MPAQDPIRVGSRLGDLTLEAELGAGAFGTVYRARDRVLGRRVALKVLRPLPAGDAEARHRLLREARALGAVAHAHVATLHRVHDLGPGGAALELELLEGGTLEEALAGGRRLPPDEAAPLLAALASGLAAAHAAQVVHGDVKPSNVLRAGDGSPKLVDFGLARLLDPDATQSSAGAAAGTPHYLAPEIVEGGPRSPAGDVWALGVLGYRVLTGRLPFDAGTLTGLFFRILNTPPAPVPDDVPSRLAQLVLACLAKRPEDRPPLAGAFLSALRAGGAAPLAAALLPARAAAPRALVGRRAELGQLLETLAEALTGPARVAVVTGPAGIGKTRLVGALADEAAARGLHVVRASASPDAGLLRPLLQALSPEGPGSGPPAAGPLPTLATAEARLLAAAAERGALVVLEDVHRGAPEDARLLGRLVARLHAARMLWVVSERVGEGGADGLGAARSAALVEGGARLVPLAPLPAEVLWRVLEEAGPGGAPPTDLVERAVARSGGNPLFALQLLSHALEARAAGPPEGGARPGPGSSEPPPALRDLMVRRLEGLPDPLREVLDAAAVDGPTFDSEALSGVLGVPPLELLRRLQRLVRGPALVVPLERGYRFAHPLLHETVYAQVAPDFRRALHGAFARALEARGEGVDPERLGAHWERSAEPARAVGPLLEAARRASQRVELWRCVDLGLRAGVVPGAVAPAFAQAHAAALFDVANALGEIGRQPEREALHADLERAARERGDEALGLRVAAWRGLSRFLGRGLEPGDEDAAARAAQALPDSLDRGVAWYVLGLAARYRRDLAAAGEHFARADAQFVRAGAVGRHGSALDQRASVALGAGRIEEAVALYREAARVCREAGRSANAEISEVNGVMAALRLGVLEGAAERLEPSVRRLEADGALIPAARVRALLAEVRYALGEAEAASALAERAVADLVGLGMKAGLVEARALAAELAAARGEEAVAAAHRAAGRAAAQDLGGEQARLRFDALDLLARWQARATSTAPPATAPGDDAGARALVAAAAPLAEADTLGDAMGPLAEALALGLPSSVVRGVLPPEPTDRRENAVVRALRAAADGTGALERGDAEGLEAAAQALARPDVGLRRALLRVVSSGWRAIAAAWRGMEGDALRSREEAQAAARSLGHRPLCAWAAGLPPRPRGPADAGGLRAGSGPA